MPDATRGGVRAVTSADIAECGIEMLMMNAFHLSSRPGGEVVKALGGLHAMSAWQGPIATDSGGFQAFSLIRENAKNGSINDRGLTFKNDGKKQLLTPAKSIQSQLRLGSDLLFCLDECTHVDDDETTQRNAVRRTIHWAKACRKEFDVQVAQRKSNRPKPLLFGVIQGGGIPALRKECAEALLEIGFDGFGFGGWPLDANGNLLTDLLSQVRELTPPSFPLHALGIGHPVSLTATVQLGYTMFDCSLPTRDARHGRLYGWAEANSTPNPESTDWFRSVYIADEEHIRASQPASEYCEAICCQNYSRGYLSHLYRSKDPTYARLATIHNLTFMGQLMKRLQAANKKTPDE